MTYKTIMLVAELVKKLAQNIGKSNSTLGKTVKSNTWSEHCETCNPNIIQTKSSFEKKKEKRHALNDSNIYSINIMELIFHCHSFADGDNDWYIDSLINRSRPSPLSSKAWLQCIVTWSTMIEDHTRRPNSCLWLSMHLYWHLNM